MMLCDARKLIRDVVQDWDSMYYNNLLSIPVLVVFSLMFEWSPNALALNL